MASIIGVETLQHTNGTTAATIDSSGRIVMPQVPIAVGSFVTVGSSQSGLTKMNLDTGSLTNGGMTVSTSTDRITVPVDGFYRVYAQRLTTGSAAYMSVRVNGGGAHVQAYGNTLDHDDLIISTILELDANDYIEFYYDGTVTYAWSGAHAAWSIELIG